MRTETEPAILETPAIPAEMWMLWNSVLASYVTSLDDAPGGTTYLVAFSHEEARNAAEHQNDTYEMNCFPVRVK